MPIPTVESIVTSEEFINYEGNKKAFSLERLKIDEYQRKTVHERTSGQRDNPTWHMLRKGRLTASNFGPVLNCKRVTPSLIKRVLGQYDLSRVQSINWGVMKKMRPREHSRNLQNSQWKMLVYGYKWKECWEPPLMVLLERMAFLK